MIRLILELLQEWTGKSALGAGSETKPEESGSGGESIKSAVSGAGSGTSARQRMSFTSNVAEKINKFFGQWLHGVSPLSFAWVSSILGCLVLLFVTGVGLWFFYSPSVSSAWESIYYIEEILPLGPWIRGVHYLTSDVLIVLSGSYLVYLVTSRLYQRGYGFMFYLWLGFLGLILFNSLNGLLLPWDQQGYWSTRIRLDITSTVPVIGPYMAKILAGGEPLGHLSLTRSTVFHTGLVPAGLIGMLGVMGVLHLLGLARDSKFKKVTNSDKDHVSRILLWSGVFFIGVIGAIVLSGFLHLWIGGEPAWGAPHLKAPADGASSYTIARPEWYFLWLFQMLKFFPGETMIIGTVVIPGLISTLIFLFPQLGRLKWGHRFNCTAGILILSVIGGLTTKAFLHDFWDEGYQRDRKLAILEGERTVELAQVNGGIPPTGAATLLAGDPMIQGPKLFAQHCASCHRYNGHNGLGAPHDDPQSAPDLYAFASQKWLEKLLTHEHFTSTNYFGGTKLADGKMAEFLAEDLSALDEENRQNLSDVVLALSAEAALPYQDFSSPELRERVEAGKEHIVDTLGCVDCHTYEIPDEEATAVDLTGYGTKDWIIRFIHDPSHPSLYGEKNDRMPSFGKEGLLSSVEIELLADWVRHDWIHATQPVLP